VSGLAVHHGFFTSSLVALRREYRIATERLIPKMQRGDKAAIAEAEALRQQANELYEWTLALVPGLDEIGGIGLPVFMSLIGALTLDCALCDEEYLLDTTPALIAHEFERCGDLGGDAA